MKRIRILIVDDHPIMGEGLEYFLNLEPDLQVLGTATSGVSGLEKLRKLNPDIVILDLSMPNMSGQEAIRFYLEAKPDVGIVIFSAHKEDHFVHQALQAGARAYVVKDSSLEGLKRAIHYVREGGYWVSPQFSPAIVASYLRSRDSGRDEDEVLDALSEREHQVLRLMIAGRETEEIAEILCISGTTVAKHRTSLLRKLGVKNLVELTRFAIRHGLIEA